jgi:hypothetical protein
VAIDYIVQFPCKVRERQSDEDLLRMRKSQFFAEIVMEQLRKLQPDAKLEDMATWKVQRMVMTPNGAENKSVTIEETLAEAAPLQALSPFCDGCPANLHKTGFGCFGAIHYPISKITEEWLVAVLPDSVEDPRLQALVKYLAAFKIDGVPVDSQRRRKEVYQSSGPTSRKWGRLFSRTVVTSSQIIHMLTMTGGLAPAQTKVLAKIFAPADANANQIGNAATVEPGITQFRYFLRAAAFAASVQANLLVDA